MFYLLIERNFLPAVGVWKSKGQRCLPQGKWEFSGSTLDCCLIEGKHSGIKIGHEQQKFGNKKISNKKDYIYKWIGNSLKTKRGTNKWVFKSFSCKEYFQKVHSKTKIPSCTNIFQALGLKYIFIYNTPMWTTIWWNVKCIFYFNHTQVFITTGFTRNLKQGDTSIEM